MIPTQIKLTNFLSYRETVVLDFASLHLACISGANGAGKSSILDGITWALFGRSRSKSDDDVVNRLAQSKGEEAEVIFTFELEGVSYRIMRRKRSGKTMILEFQVATPNGEWKSLTESRLKETQEAIESLLRMNYDTFINASFFLQGQADEFTTKTPNKRKQILADLLGLTIWDRYKEAATERRREAENEQQLVDSRLEEIERELAEEPSREAALVEAEENLKQVERRLESQEMLLAQLRRTEAAVNQQKQLISSLAANLERARVRLDNLQQSQRRRQEERAGYQNLLDQADEIAVGFAAWETAEEQLQAWQARAEQHNRLLQEQRPHELILEKERSRLAQRQRELQSQKERIEAMDAEKAALSETRIAGQERLAGLEKQLTELAEAEQTWREAEAALRTLEGERQLLAQESEQLRKQAARIAAQREERLTVAENLTGAESALKEVTDELVALSGQLERLMAAQADRDTRASEQTSLREKMDKLDGRRKQLAEDAEGVCPLCGQTLTEQHRQEVLTELEAEGRQWGDRYRENRALIPDLEAEIGRLSKQISGKDRLERTQQAQQQRLATAQARLDSIDETAAEWTREGASRLEELEALLADEAAFKAQRSEVERLASLAKSKKELEKARQAEQAAISRVEARLSEIERARADWAANRQPELAAVDQRLASGDIVPEAQAALAELAIQIEALAYDSAAHEASRQARDEKSAAQERYQRLQQARAAVKPLEDTLAELADQVAEQAGQVTEQEDQLTAARQQLESILADDGDLEAVEGEVFQLREERIAANRRVATALQDVAVLAERRQQKKATAARRSEITQRIQRLKVLEKACGREGVQALLIEQALPEIEDDANELLERLTGGAMRIIFDTQRKLKSSDRIAETLDIHIGDDTGERPYENFSGGEQFRVNFAIRLALSRILAKRAGARLQTLVIDEGFGSQDPDGRQRLIEAINTVQNDFARVLVITHIDELRDAFPNRIEVEKEAAGSRITVY